MPIASIQRRLSALELVIDAAPIPEYPPLTESELESIVQKAHADERLSRIEVARLEQQSPVIYNSEYLITCHSGKVFIKRYIGIDLNDL